MRKVLADKRKKTEQTVLLANLKVIDFVDLIELAAVLLVEPLQITTIVREL